MLTYKTSLSLFIILISILVITPEIRFLIAVLLSVVTGSIAAVAYNWKRIKNLRLKESDASPDRSSAAEFYRMGSEEKKEKPESCFNTRLLISKNVDPVIEELIDYCLRDFILCWYLEIVKKDNHHLDLRLKNEFWIIISRLLTRIRSIDEVAFFTKDVIEKITEHFQKVNRCLVQKEEFVLSGHLMSTEKEIEFLRRIADLLLKSLVPPCYTSISPLHLLLREVIAIQALHNSIELFCDPDYLNQKLIDYIKWQEDEASRSQKVKYAYAETYDDFIELIKKTQRIEDLKRMRYFIVTEIMQSTAINNLKREKGYDTSKEKSESRASSVKGDHLLGRNLPRYINQLRYAKKLVEKRMSYLTPNPDGIREGSPSKMSFPNTKSKKVISFSIIMSHDETRKYFYEFLKNSMGTKSSSLEKSSHYLVLFWESVDQMKRSESVKQVEIAHELLTYSYFLTSINNHIKMPKEILKDMESFIMGNLGPEAYYQTQKVVYKILEDRYYPLFIVSKAYDEMVQNKPTQVILSSPTSAAGAEVTTDNSLIDANEYAALKSENPSVIEEHICFTYETLAGLRKVLQSKTDSLKALNHTVDISSQPTEATSKRIQKLEKEVTEIEEQIHENECHAARSQLWLRYLGQWRSELYSIQSEEESGSTAAIIVHLGSMAQDMRCDAWVIARSMNEIINLKRKLVKIRPHLTKHEIFRLKKMNECENLELVRKAKSSLNNFFHAILSDEACYKSEEVYLFFISSPENLRSPLSTIKNPEVRKSSLPFMNLLGIVSTTGVNFTKQHSSEERVDDEELSRYFDELEGKEFLKDDIAEPAYQLVNEVFELQDSLGWLRKSLIAFVQISYGQTINKQIRESVSWLSSESMIYYYLSTFRDSLWPDGKRAKPFKQKTAREKEETQVTARAKLMNNIPDFLTNLIGDQNSKKGLLKLFDLLQHKQLNKQLFYELLQIFLFHLVPEVRRNHHNTTTSGGDTTPDSQSKFYS